MQRITVSSRKAQLPKAFIRTVKSSGGWVIVWNRGATHRKPSR